MSKDSDKDDRSFDQMLQDIEGHIESMDKASPEAKEPAPPEVPEPAPPSKSGEPLPPDGAEEELDLETQKRLDAVTETFRQQKQAEQKQLQRRRRISAAIFLPLVVLAGLVFYFHFTSERSVDGQNPDASKIDPLAPGDSRVGDIFKKDREMFEEGQKLLASGNYSGLERLKNLTEKSPFSPQSADALLLMATTQRFNLNEPKKAMETYALFLKRFPDHREANRTRKHLIRMLVANDMKEQAIMQANSLLEHAQTPHDKAYARHFLDLIKSP